MFFSIIICSINPEKFGKISQNYTALMGDDSFEIIGIHDAKSLCEGYNRGIKQSLGDILIFSHDDIEILSLDFVAKLKSHLKNFDIVGLAGTDRVLDGYWLSAGVPHLYGQVSHPCGTGYGVECYDLSEAAHQGKVATGQVRMLDGLFFAAHRAVVQKVTFDEQSFDGFHCYDADFTYSAFLAGFSLAVCNNLAVIHYSSGNFDAVFQKYNQIFVAKHANSIDTVTPRALKPSWQAVNCPDKESVVSTFTPEVQNRLYEYFLSTSSASSLIPASVNEKKMTQTPIHDQHNPDLLSLIPIDAQCIIEVGCSSGALAKAYRELNSGCKYVGTEIDSDYAQLARQHCNQVIVGDIEKILDEIKLSHGDFDCWIFGDVLEHLYDPWRVLKRIAQDMLKPNGSVVACIPNMQHWSLQFALNVGNVRYQDAGLLDRTHLRWFTRVTIIEMFQAAGLKIVHMGGRIFDEPDRENFLPLLRDLAEASGGDPDQAIADARPLQWVVRAVAA